jgi:hypothetical protein
MPDVPNAVYEERLRLLENSLLEGMNVTAVIRAAAKQFGISERQGWKDYRTIRRRWAKAPKTREEEEERRFRLARAEMRRNDLYRRALATGDIATALRVEDSMAKLFGLFPAENVEVKHSGDVPILEIYDVWPELPQEGEHMPPNGVVIDQTPPCGLLADEPER